MIQKRLQRYGKKVNEKGAKSYKNGQNRNKRMFYIIFFGIFAVS